MRRIHKTGIDQIVEEHKHYPSIIGKHFRDDHHGIPRDFDKQFFELKMQNTSLIVFCTKWSTLEK